MATIRSRKWSDGRITYQVMVRVKGSKPASKSFDKKTDAKRWANKIETEIGERRHFGTRESLTKTFKDLVYRYLENELSKRKSDQNKVKMHLNWWQKHLGSYYLADITPQMISELRDKLAVEWIKKGPKALEVQRQPATVRLYLASLSTAFTTAQKDWGWIESNPVKTVRKPRVDNARTRYLEPEEQKELLAAARKDSNPHIYDFILLAICTGARWSEISELTWKNIDFKGDKPVMTLEKTKNGETRRVPLTGPAVPMLKAKRQANELKSRYVFPNLAGDAPMQLRKAWERVVGSANLQDFKFHDLRHTTASYLANSGSGLHEIGKILGHRNQEVTKRYSHLTDQYTHDVMERMTTKHFDDYEALAT